MSLWVTVFLVWERGPFEGLEEYAESVEARGGYGVDLLVHGEGGVEYDAEVTGMVCGCGRVTEGRGPPGVVPHGGGGSEDEDFHFLRVVLQAAASHPGCDVLHSFLETVW